MSTLTHSPTRSESRSLLGRLDPAWLACTLSAAVVLSVAAFMPLWTMVLHAPQYPGGLKLTAYGTDMRGDLDEINVLNHYVGVAAIDPATVLELRLFPFAMSLLVALVVLAAFVAQERKLRIAVMALTWSAPVAMLMDLQFWLYRYGHDLNPEAPVRVEPFTPRVVGTTNVIQFQSETMVAAGFWLMVVAALLVTAGPWLLRFVAESWKNTGGPTAAGAIVVLAVAGGVPTADAHQASVKATSIAAAIEAAAPGDTVVIPAGVYRENLVVTKPVTLVAEGEAIIDGGGKGDVVRLEADGVTLRGFTIRNSGRDVADEPAGIRAIGHRATIEGSRIEEVLYGVVLQNSNHHVVRQNQISSITSFPAERRGHAVYLWYSDGSRVEENRVELAKDGFFLGFATNTEISRNVVTGVRYGIHYMYADHNSFTSNTFRESVAGAAIMYSSDIKLFDNEFAHNRSGASGYGLLFKDVDDVEMVNNRIHHNRIGLTMEGAPRTPGSFVTLRQNLIGYNETALSMFSTTSVTFVENTFTGNVQQVEGRGGDVGERNTWAVDGRGNYWDDYRGFDANGDGVGDLEYRYEGAFDELVQRSEALRAYSFTFARTAVDLSARWFPVYRPKASVVDPHPLMRPTVTLAEGPSEGVARSWIAIGLALAAGPSALLVASRRSGRKEWQPC